MQVYSSQAAHQPAATTAGRLSGHFFSLTAGSRLKEVQQLLSAEFPEETRPDMSPFLRALVGALRGREGAAEEGGEEGEGGAGWREGQGKLAEQQQCRLLGERARAVLTAFPLNPRLATHLVLSREVQELVSTLEACAVGRGQGGQGLLLAKSLDMMTGLASRLSGEEQCSLSLHPSLLANPARLLVARSATRLNKVFLI